MPAKPPTLSAPQNGVTVRMYRQGHGDCFLLAFPGEAGDPVFMLIDCGLKAGSEVHKGSRKILLPEIIDDIDAATGGRLDVVAITHEHEDHVNGFLAAFGTGAKKQMLFERFKIGQVWLAWTEDPDDDFANDLRNRFNDTLLGLHEAEQRLLASTASEDSSDERYAQARIEELRGFELFGAGGSKGTRAKSGTKITGERFKVGMQQIKRQARNKVLFLDPFARTYTLPRVPGVRVYALGPPRDEDLLLSLDPEGPEEFSRALGLGAPGRFTLSAVLAASKDPGAREALRRLGGSSMPFNERYLERMAQQRHAVTRPIDAYNDPADKWRRIENDWLLGVEQIALRLNSEVNNTSLVLAIELPHSKKVLLFVGDAQRGSWVSWTDGSWPNPEDPGQPITARDLLARTVLYKVGHHGSHNATLNGSESDDYPNLAWMARGDLASEFVAMIPSNKDWAYHKTGPWEHPLQSIEAALRAKARGRVFMTCPARTESKSGGRAKVGDHRVKKPRSVPKAEWDAFKSRVVETELYLQYTVPDT
jgi:hypothetical protein